MQTLSPFSYTSEEFSSLMRERLGKGAQHALLLYREWYQTGGITGADPAFINAGALFEQMKANLTLNPLHMVEGKHDGFAEKLLFKTEEGLEVESVVIPMEAGGTLCVSSQVGCRMGCRFCETGRMGLLKNLTPAEIVAQVFYARHLAKADVRNIVFMGMGEPFDNYEAVMQAVRVMSDPHGLNIGPRHMTISTSGRVDEIRKFAEETGPCPYLAVSINGSTDQKRTKLMPINRTHDMRALYEAILFYNQKTRKTVLAAYVLIKGENDTLEDAKALGEYLKGLDVKVNLIPYNPQSHDRFSAPEGAQVELFKQALMSEGYQVLVRKSRGDQIMAACGQLGNQSSRKFFARE